METKLFAIILAIGCIIAVLAIFKQGFDNSANSPQVGRNKLLLTSIIVIGWVIYISILAFTGVMRDWNNVPPRFFLLLFFPAQLSITYIVFSGKADNLINGINGKWLVYVQTFRILVEILLWLMLKEGLIPIQMTFEGLNFDILVGLTAPIAAYLIYKVSEKPKRGLLLGWNLIGLVLLLNIVTVAILSTPVPFRVFMNEPANTIIANFPYVFIPGVYVVLAFTMHFMSIRKWYIER